MVGVVGIGKELAGVNATALTWDGTLASRLGKAFYFHYGGLIKTLIT